jgi:hypothetical protein
LAISGSHVVLGRGFPAMRSPDGMRAMAHELAHVVRSGGQHVDLAAHRELGGSGDHGHETRVSG